MNTPAGVAGKLFEHLVCIRCACIFGKCCYWLILAGAFHRFGWCGSFHAHPVLPRARRRRSWSAPASFPAALPMVLLAGSELFTGNCLLIIPLLSQNSALCAAYCATGLLYICGNLIWGAVLVAALAVYSHQLSQFFRYTGGFRASAQRRQNAALTFGDAFLRGIACNFLVCIAVWISFAATDAIGKIAGLYFPILLFVVSGFEHSVANMFYVPVGILAKGVPEYAQAAAEAGVDLSGLNWQSFLQGNLLPVTLGNIVGGLAVGVIYWYCYLKDKKEQERKAGRF